MKIGAILNPKTCFFSGIFLLCGLNIETIAAPLLYNIETEPLQYLEGSGEESITGTISINAGFFLRSATIRISSGYHPDEDVLSYYGTSGITASWDKSTGILSLSGFASVSRYRTALRSVKYQNINTLNASGEMRKVSFMVNDGSGNSNIVSREITIISSNRKPLLSHLESLPIIYCHSSDNMNLTSSVVVEDDNTNLTSATVSITSGYVQNADVLSFTNQNGITGNWDNSTGILTLLGSSLVKNYQEALRSIRFGTTNPSNSTRRVSIKVNDDESESNIVVRSIDVFGRLTATFSGGGNACKEDIKSLDLTVAFSGTAPWSFSLSRNGLPDKSFSNITVNPYSFNVDKEGIYKILSFADEHCKGDTAGSGTVGILARPSPTAVISGTDTICSGGTAELQIVFTGTAPWTVTLNTTGSEPVEITSNTNIYVLKVMEAATYSLSKLYDALCNGSVSGTGRVLLHQPPTAIISGSESVCEGTPANIQVSLTGASPWMYSYRINSGNPVEIKNVLNSPSHINALKAGNYTLAAVSDRICSGNVSGSANVTLLPSPDVNILGLKEVYSKEDEWVELTANPSGGEFSGSGVIPYGEKWYFIPSLPPVGTHNIVYKYRVSPESCYGYDTVAVRILKTSAEIQIESGRTRFCRNDAPFLVTGLNLINDSTGSFTISGGIGLIDHHNNTATVIPSQLSVNQYTIYYTLHNGTTIPQLIEIGNELSVDFTWSMECFENNRPVVFINTTTSPFGFLSDTSFSWVVETDSGFMNLATRNVSHTYALPGIYRIRLKAENSYGCVDSLIKEFQLKPVIALAGENYFEDFEETSFWKPESANGLHSWQLGTPEATANTFAGASSGEKCWFTHIPGISAPAEESRISGPCFDFRGTDKPTLVSQIWRAFIDSKDGANIQYTIDDGVTWIPIGNLNDGINWFNGYYGTPGAERKGWTDIKDTRWTETRHSLDFLKGNPKVQFRFTYSASGNALGNDGLAFDDFQIVERNRMILIEHFTNTSDLDCSPADSALNSITNNYPSNVINLQYHTSYPPDDPFNGDNPVVPTTRQFYYNLSDVPYAIINGGKESSQRIDYQSTHLNQDQIIIQSLYDSDFSLNVKTMVENNILYLETVITALAEVPLTELSLRMAVIEPEVFGIKGNNGDTVFRNVVKDMIPGPAGITLYRSWNQGETLTLVEPWAIRNEYASDSFRVVAFLQNESSREVLQTALDTRDIFSGNRDPEKYTELSVEIFPNPAQNFINVFLGDVETSDIRLMIYNNLGELVYTSRLIQGTRQVEINTGHLPDGLYMIKILSTNNHTGTQKFVISK